MRTYFILAVVTLLAGGCGGMTIDVQGVEPGHRMKLAVMDFPDTGAYKSARDYNVGGSVGSEHPDILVARAVRVALAKCPQYDVMTWLDMRRGLKGLKEILPISDLDAITMGKSLGVEAVVVGTVEAYRETWVLPLCGWSKVAFTARCLEVSTGKELWRAHVVGSQHGAIEEDLAANLCREMHDQLHAKGQQGPKTQ